MINSTDKFIYLSEEMGYEPNIKKGKKNEKKTKEKRKVNGKNTTQKNSKR